MMSEAVYLGAWLLWVGWAVQAVLSVLQVRKFYYRVICRGSREAWLDYEPRAVVIVPFKGAEHDLKSAIRALCEQDYADYRLLCVVESEADSAYPVLNQVLGEYPGRKLEVLVAGMAGSNEGQKVHNQLAAIGHVEKELTDEDVLVFADSDAVVGPLWLRRLVGPLCVTDRFGVSTGYRWLIPVDDDVPVWTHLASVINSSVACMYVRYNFNHAWGGSMAMRVDTARRGELVRRLTAALSDDYQVTRMCQDLDLDIGLVPECLVASPTRLDRESFFNFARRQYVITRVYAPKVFWGALGVMGLYVCGLLTALAGLMFGLIRGDLMMYIPAAAVLIFVFIANQLRSSYRRRIVEKAFGQEVLHKLRTALWIDRWLTGFYMSVHFLMILSAAVGRVIEWRGVKYRLDGPQNVQILR